MKLQPNVKYATRGILFFLVILLLSSSPLFKQWELFLLDIGRMSWVERAPTADQQNLYCLRDLRNNVGLKETHKLVAQLKRLGAKAVVMGVREGYPQEELKYLDSLVATDIVVFGVRPTTKFGEFHFGTVTQSAAMDLIVDRPNLPPKSEWGVFANRYNEDGVARRFVPYGCVVWEKGDTIPDVALLVAAKYYGFPSNTVPHRDGNTVAYGDLRIPILNDGSAYVLSREWSRGENVDVLESIRFVSRTSQGWVPEMMRGKIVYLGNGQCGTIGTLLGRRFVTPAPGWLRTILLAIFVLLAVLAGIRYKPGRIILITGTAALVYFAGSFALFVWGGWYVEIVSPFLCLLFGGIVFAYSRSSNDTKALETEKKRILESQKEKLEQEVAERTAELRIEKEETERLLYNILPVEVAKELQEKGSILPRRYEEISVLFSDFKGFTSTVSAMPAGRLVDELNDIFQVFDDIIDKHGIEKIKTIGDSYLIAAGLPKESGNHAIQCVRVALEMLRFIEQRNASSAIKWQMRVGIHSGTVVAGVVGKKKFTYDVWGDTVNIAQRMEASGVPGRVNVSAYTYHLVKDRFTCEYRGKIDAKGKGEIDMYFVLK